MKYPITPEYLKTAPDPIADLYLSLEETVIRDICRRFKLSGTATNSAIEQIKILKRRGYDQEEIEEVIAKTLNMSREELDKLFGEAVERNKQYYGGVFDKVQLLDADVDMLDAQSEIDAIYAQTAGEFKNITQSLGFAIRDQGEIKFLPIAETYQKILDDAELEVWSGAVDYNTAIKNAVKRLADSGLQTMVDYASGWHNRVDVAARRAIMTGITQISRQYSESAAETLETPYREVTAHVGARDKPGPSPWSSHKEWQGKVYSVKEGDKYPSIYRVCGLGFVDGLTGANCRHLYYPFVDGVSERTWTDEQLKNIDPPPFEYQGKEYTAYEATQKQRQIETAIRQAKRDCLVYKESGLELDYTDASIKLKRLRAEYKSFSAVAGLREQPERMRVKEYSIGSSDRSKISELKVKRATEKPIRDAIKNGDYPKTINHEKQMRHMGKYALPGRSVVTITEEELQEIINNNAGGGKILIRNDGAWDKKEIINAGKEIGYTKNQDGVIIKTSSLKLHYSKTGVHAVPYSRRWKR